MQTPIIIRQSLLKRWLSCPMSYFFEREDNVLGRKSKSTNNIAAGVLTHEYIKRTLLGLSKEGMEEEVANAEGVDETEISKLSQRFIVLWEELVKNNKPEFSDLELTIEGKGLDETHSLLGTIDLIHDEFDTIKVVDWKTTSSWAIPVTGMPAHRMQAGFYALLLERSKRRTYTHVDSYDIVYLIANKARGSTKVVTLTREEIEEEKENVVECIMAMSKDISEVDMLNKPILMNPCSCNDFFKPCQFMKRCFPRRHSSMVAALKVLDGEE